MAKEGATYEGPLSVKEGGLRLYDPIRITKKHSEERFARLVLTSAQMLAAVAATTLFPIVPAPGSGKYIEYLCGSVVMKHGGTAYTGTGNVIIRYGATFGGAGAANASGGVSLNLFDSAVADVIQSIPPATATYAIPANTALNLAWNTGAPGASLTGGNGQMIVLVSYRIQDIGL